MSSPQLSADPPARKTWSVGTLTYTSTGLAILFAWLLFGDFAWSMRDRSVGPMAAWYLSHLGVPNLLFGILTSSFPALVALILGPVISVSSDRHRGRLGRRIPFLLVTTPIAAFGMVGLALTPFISRSVHAAIPAQSELFVSVVCFGLFWAAFEFGTVAGQAVFGGLINDVVPQEWLGRFYGLFRAVSLIDGIVFNFWIMGKVPTHFTLIMLVVALFYGCAFMWVCLRVKEGEYPPPPPKPAEQKSLPRRFKSEVALYVRECFSHKYYLLVFVMLMMAAVTYGPVNIFSLPYAASLDISMHEYGKALATTYFVSLCLSFFLGWLADLFHPLRMAMATLLGYAVVTFCGGIFAGTKEAFLVTFVLHGILSGCYFTSAASLAQRLFPREKFAQFASAAGIFISIAGMAVAPVTGTWIDLSGNQYRLCFVAACILSLIALGVSWMVYKRFKALGGPKNYSAPEV